MGKAKTEKEVAMNVIKHQQGEHEEKLLNTNREELKDENGLYTHQLK